MKVLRCSSSVKTRCIPSGLSGPQTKQVFVGSLRSLVSWPGGLLGMEGFYLERVRKSFGPLRSLRTAAEFAEKSFRIRSRVFFLGADSCIHIGFEFSAGIRDAIQDKLHRSFGG